MPSVDFDLQRFIDTELQAGKKRIIVPPGHYRVMPHDRQHLVLRNLKDITIVADGVEMICTETTRALTITHCTNLTLRGLVIDYDPLPFTQGRISELASDKKTQEIELFDGYPAAEMARNFKYEIFRPDTRTLRCDDRFVKKIEAVGSRHLRSPRRTRTLLRRNRSATSSSSVPNPRRTAARPMRCSAATTSKCDWKTSSSLPRTVLASLNRIATGASMIVAGLTAEARRMIS